MLSRDLAGDFTVSSAVQLEQSQLSVHVLASATEYPCSSPAAWLTFCGICASTYVNNLS